MAAAAGKLGLGFEVVQAGTESEIDAAFTTLAREHAQVSIGVRSGPRLEALARHILDRPETWK